MDPRLVAGGVQIKSMLCAPLRHKQLNFGVVNLSNTSDRLFSIEDLRTLNSLANYASIAILNAKNVAQLNNTTDDILRHATILNM